MFLIPLDKIMIILEKKMLIMFETCFVAAKTCSGQKGSIRGVGIRKTEKEEKKTKDHVVVISNIT